MIGQDSTTYRQLAITNTGTADLKWEIQEVVAGEIPAATGSSVGPGAQRQPTGGRLATEEYAEAQDSLARTTEGLTPAVSSPGTAPGAAPGEVVAQWPTTEVISPYGLGTTDETVWVSDSDQRSRDNTEFQTDGTLTGAVLDADWADAWHADMTADRNGNMCQLNVSAVGGDNGIYCWDRETGEVDYSLNGPAWTVASQRGLGYDAVEDVFYVGGWNEGVVYTVAGQSFETPGATLSHCSTVDRAISGLGFDPLSRTLWVATNSETNTIYQVDPHTCSPVSAIGGPGAAPFSGAGLEVGPDGDLWAVDQVEGVVRRIATGSPSTGDVPWLEFPEGTGSVAPGEQAVVPFTVNPTGLEPGAYEASLLVSGTAGRTQHVQVPVTLVVSKDRPSITVGGAVASPGSLN